MQVSATRVSVGWRRARGGDVVDPWREAAPVWRPRWCLLWPSWLVMAPMTRTESTGPLLMVSGSSSAPTGPQPRGRPRPAHRNSFHRHRLRAAWQCGRARGRDDGRILVTVVSTSRLPVVAEMLRARWPSSPTSCSCGCLHKGSNAQAVSKTGEAARSLARADGQRKWRRAEAARARSLRSRAGAGADIARTRPRARAPAARARLQHAHRPCARSGRADRKLRRMRGGRPGWGAHLWIVGWCPWAPKRLVTT